MIDYCFRSCSNGLKFEENSGQSKNDFPVSGTPTICDFPVSRTPAICNFLVSRTTAICHFPVTGTLPICDYPASQLKASRLKV